MLSWYGTGKVGLLHHWEIVLIFQQKPIEIILLIEITSWVHPEADLLLFESYLLFYLRYHPKIIGGILKNEQKTSTSVYDYMVIRGYIINDNENEAGNEK